MTQSVKTLLKIIIDFNRVANARVIGGKRTTRSPKNHVNARSHDDINIPHILFIYHIGNIIILAYYVLRMEFEIVNVLLEMLKM
jgi:hypothetical protein